jgi:hypothetical protein
MDQKAKNLFCIREILGILLIVDGILQFQPEMPYGFLSFVILPSIQATSSIYLQNLLMLGYKLWEIHPFQFDALSGAFQVFLGAAFLLNDSKKALKFISTLSIAWFITIWVMGEGFGGIPEIGVSLLTGFPGSAFIYILLALPMTGSWFSKKIGMEKYLEFSLIFIFIMGAILQLIPGNSFWNSGQLSYHIFMNTFYQGENPILFNLLIDAYPLILYHEMYLNIILSLLMVASALVIAMKLNWGVYLIAFFVLLIWVFFQNMGIFIPPATDPNTGLPLALLVILYAQLLVEYKLNRFNPIKDEKESKRDVL